MSARSRAGVFSALSQGLKDVTSQIQTGISKKKEEEIRKEKEAREEPLRELRIKSAQQSVASGALELERQKSIDQDEADFQAILKQLESRPALQQKFQDEIQKGAEQLQEQNKQGNVEQPQVPFAPKEEPPERQAAISAQPQVLPGPNQAPVQGPTQLTQEGEQIGEQLEMSEAERRLQSINKFRGSRSPAIQNELKVLQEQVDREKQLVLDKQRLDEERAFRTSEREATQEFRTEEREAGELFRASQLNLQKKASEDSAKELAKQNLFNNADKLGKRFDTISKTYNAVRDAYKRVKASAEDPSAAGDLALIFNYMKMLDPGSVVRESEFRTADQARAWLTKSEEGGIAVPSVVVQAIQRAGTGQRLLPKQRNDFVNRSDKLFTKQAETQQEHIDRYSDLATQFEIDPSLVVAPIEEGLLVTKKQAEQNKAENVFTGSDTLKPGQPSKQVQKSYIYNPKTGELEAQ